MHLRATMPPPNFPVPHTENAHICSPSPISKCLDWAPGTLRVPSGHGERWGGQENPPLPAIAGPAPGGEVPGHGHFHHSKKPRDTPHKNLFISKGWQQTPWFPTRLRSQHTRLQARAEHLRSNFHRYSDCKGRTTGEHLPRAGCRRLPACPLVLPSGHTDCNRVTRAEDSKGSRQSQDRVSVLTARQEQDWNLRLQDLKFKVLGEKQGGTCSSVLLARGARGRASCLRVQCDHLGSEK